MKFLLLLLVFIPQLARAQAPGEWCYIYLTRDSSADISIKTGTLTPQGIETAGGRLDVRLVNQFKNHVDSYEFSIYNPTGKYFWVTVKTRVFGGIAETHKVYIDHWYQHLITVPVASRDNDIVRLRVKTPIKKPVVLNGVVVYGDGENPYQPVNQCE